MRRRLAVLGVLSLALVGASPARADDAVVPTATEAWYATLPAVPPRPAHTLHVGVTAGVEDARTYLSLDVSEVPSDAVITGGALTLPVDAADSTSSDSATIDVCLAPSPGPAVEGSSDAPPAIDCAVHSPAVLAGDAFTVDLAPFASKLRTSGLALIPADGTTATWHVALWARGNDAADAVPVTARLTLERGAGTTFAPPPSPPTTGAVAGTDEFAAPVFSAPGTGFAEPVRPTLPPAEAHGDPGLAPSLGVAPVPIAGTPKRYADSLVFALPLALLALVGYFGAALTRPITVPEPGERRPTRGLPVPRPARPRARAAREPRASG